MYINWIEYENETSGRRISRVNFSRLNLLVGASAAGKTTILRIITNFLLTISMGHAIKEQCRFKMSFSIVDRLSDKVTTKKYLWEVRTGEKDILSTEGAAVYPICYECLQKLTDHKQIISREENSLYIEGYQNLPQVSKMQSAIYIYRENVPFNAIVDDIRLTWTIYNQDVALNKVTNELLEQIKKIIKEAQDNKHPIRWHYAAQNKFPMSLFIYIVKKTYPKKYRIFLEDLQDIFPEIEDVYINQKINGDGNYYLSILQRGQWILPPDISSGMIRTIYLLACLHFCECNTMVLFDELENSLGINCLDEIVERIRMMENEKKIQFMLTSHHPYVINQIPADRWLVVSQNDNLIESKKAEELRIGRMKSELFFELINYLKRQLV